MLPNAGTAAVGHRLAVGPTGQSGQNLSGFWGGHVPLPLPSPATTDVPDAGRLATAVVTERR
jgi:hypothetical protein